MHPVNNNEGSALIIALMILVVVTIIGVSSMNTSTIEIKIASNDRLYKTSFYAADGGTEVGRELIEQNIACADGFNAEPLTIGSVEVVDKDFAFQENEPTAGDYPSDTERDIRWPKNDAQPHTNLTVFGNTELSTGSALQMAAGYEGKGKGSASGGGQIIYNVFSKHQGRQKSNVCIRINYRHLIGSEGVCKY
ncbi:pilus assembly PilX N-terminal domain-containing protein [uncultured Desulfobacter sp.]|uniref:pilus assembly PilX family protein n=1 Tax=uncultured Desulfobacter sp. TaxID=240139 RepID=UPI002AA704F7|nr:pilus assembly PilX N-terminal domain-containing protein [uncultured Desulfobacter sp.]